MAAKKEQAKVIERVYNVPLRKEFMKVPRLKKTKKAVSALRQFLSKHMKSKEVKIGKEVNEKLWQHGIKNPPHHIKVNVRKDENGIVTANLFGVEIKEAPKKEVKKKSKLAEKIAEAKKKVK